MEAKAANNIPEEIRTIVIKRIESWKDRLQDLSGRNRLLFFKPTKSSTLEISHPDINELFQRLVIDGKSMEFPVMDEEDLEEEEDNDIEDMEIQYKPNEIGVKQPPNSVNRILFNLRSQSNTAQNERGINVLYLALGLLKWRESLTGEFSKAPLVMVPISIEPESFGKPYRLNVIEDDIILNTSLRVKLQSDFKFELPKLPKFIQSYELREYFSQVNEAVTDYQGWEVIPEAVIGIFNFQNLIIINDLEKNVDTFINSSFIQSLSTGKLEFDLPTGLITKEELDDKVHPSQVFQVLDADSSQQQVIEAAKSGLSMIIQGPPGTGKSQTIANIIAEFLALGKRVLFVSQKMAALEVVKTRLTQVDLGDFCLEVHSHRRDKKEVISELGESLEHRENVVVRDVDVKMIEIENKRKRLNEYVRVLHKPQLALEITPFEVFGELARLEKSFDLRFRFDGIEKLKKGDLLNVLSIVDEFEAFDEIISGHDAYPWRGAKLRKLTLQDREDLEGNLRSVAQDVKRLCDFSEQLAKEYGVVTPESLHECSQLLRVARNYKQTILGLPLEDIFHRFEIKYTSFGRYFMPEYWKDRREIKEHAIGGRLPGYEDTKKSLKYSLAIKTRTNSELPENKREFSEEELNTLQEYSELARQIADAENKLRGNFNPNDRPDVIESFYSLSLDHLVSSLTVLADNMDMLTEWMQYIKLRSRAQEQRTGDFVEKAIEKKIAASSWSDVFQRRFYRLLLDLLIQSNRELGNFKGISHGQLINQFRKLDKERIELAKRQIHAKIVSRHPDAKWMRAGSAEEVILRREMNKKRKKPLKKLFQEIPDLLTTLKPCLMMSPLTVSQHLDPELFHFDLLIFDEASQILPEYAIGALARAKQVVIAGDKQQLPPTTFFQGLVAGDDDNGFDEFESILNESDAIGVPSKPLNWHYRSQDEALIAFSNYHFYGNRLYTFPSADTSDETTGVSFQFVEDGVYKRGAGGRHNLVEARAVVKNVIEHYQTHPKKSLGVVTFSWNQKIAIEDLLHQTLREWPTLQYILNDEGNEPFFVKNLEMVQGDERDYIFFSIGYGYDEVGKFLMNFGPLNRAGGERRLNVAVTRARRGVKVISSFQPEDIDLARTESRGVQLLKSYLNFARDGVKAIYADYKEDDEAVFDSPFEHSVYDALLARGLEMKTQIGESGYRIDLAVVDPEKPGRRLLGIECDGAMYHSAATARDRDRLRQSILEGLGWTIHRIWSRDWFENSNREIEKVLELVEKVKTKPNILRSEPKKNNRNEKKIEDDNGDDAEPPKDILDSKAKLPPGTSYYQFTDLPFMGHDVNSFYRASDRKVIDVIKLVVESEGPISNQLVKRRIAKAWNINRIGQKLKFTLDRKILHAVNRGIIIEKDYFLWPKDMQVPMIRVPGSSGKKRSLDEISLEELAEGAYLCMKHAMSMSPDDLVKETAWLFGSKVSKSNRERIIKSIRLLEKGKRIQWRGEKIRLPRS